MNKLIELKNAIKCNVLFRSEDGVGIYEGDTYYALEDNYKDTWLKIVRYVGSTQPNGVKQFSKKEKAENYILMNKPCLSINDVKSFITRDWLETDLKELVKSKLNESNS